MKIAVLKERQPYESRVALTPDTAKKFINDGFDVWCERGAGELSCFRDEEYAEAGVHLSSIPLEIVADADIVLKVQPTPQDQSINEIQFMRPQSIIIGVLSPFSNIRLAQDYAQKNITAIAVELIPRITRAQNMDILSSQNNLIGYRSVIEALMLYGRSAGMLITAAGTLAPAKILIIGAGVAGLQAASTAKRLGAIVSAHDIRKDAQTQIESVGARFIGFDNTEREYNQEIALELQKKQEALLNIHVPKNDIVITTAQTVGKNAPKLISHSMITNMKYGSVIVDASTASGGNVEGSVCNDITNICGVTIIGYSNLASRISHDSSKLYSNNLYHFVTHAFKNGNLNIHDEIVKATLITHNSKIL